MEQEEIIWAMYFSSITSFRFHPRNSEELRTIGKLKVIDECAVIADFMLGMHRARFLREPQEVSDGVDRSDN